MYFYDIYLKFKIRNTHTERPSFFAQSDMHVFQLLWVSYIHQSPNNIIQIQLPSYINCNCKIQIS